MKIGNKKSYRKLFKPDEKDNNYVKILPCAFSTEQLLQCFLDQETTVMQTPKNILSNSAEMQEKNYNISIAKPQFIVKPA